MKVVNTSNKRILTGIQSTGIPHLGNLLGAILPALELSKETQESTFFFVANLHTLTSQRNPNQVFCNTEAVVATWLACGFNTEKDLIYRQSMIPEVCELAWYLNCITPYRLLANAHAFKMKSAKLSHINGGLFTYPVLMAADIILYNATHVPVGQDQQQHIEIARVLAKTFNNTYEPIFTIPQAFTKEKVATLPGTDGRKMSKSYNNTINIFVSDEQLKKAIMSIQTDSTPLADPKNTDTCNVFQLYKSIAPSQDVQNMKERYTAGGYGYGEAKKELLQAIITRFSQVRKDFQNYIKTSDNLEKILQRSEKKVRAIAFQTLDKVRKAVGVAAKVRNPLRNS